MAQLAQAIAQAKAAEIAQNEARLAEQLELPPVALDDETKQHLSPFIRFTTTANVRYCPALPTTVGAFVLKQSASGVSTEAILRQLEAVARLHDSHGLPNPTATAATRSALEREFAFPVPRSWTTAEKQTFLTLPAEIRAAISRREQDRETRLRRSQNEAAELRKRLSVSGTDKPAETTERTTPMAKWNGPQGSKDMEKDPLVRQPDKGFPPVKDISRKVDSNWKINDGFAGPLDSKE